MIIRAIFLIGTTLGVAGAANGHSIRVLGSDPNAQACYRAADQEVRQPHALALCDRALAARNLDRRDQMATLVNRGIVRFRLDDTQGALGDFDAALMMEPNQPDALINKGITMLASGSEIDGAVAVIDQGLEGRPQRPWVGYYGRAVAHELAGRDRQAYRDYRRASELRPGWRLAEDALARFSVRS